MSRTTKVLESYLQKEIPEHKFSFRTAVYVDGKDSGVCWGLESEEELLALGGKEGEAALLAAVVNQIRFCLRRLEHPEEDWRVSSETVRRAAGIELITE